MIGPFDGLYGFLSNFYMWPVEYEGVMYKSCEHAFQAAKTLDPNLRAQIAKAATPNEAKKLGRKLAVRKDWEQIKLQVMETCLRDKFSDPSMKKMLLDTGDEELVEVNHWGDCFWGQCHGIGSNHLGKLLMKIRAEFKPSEPSDPNESSDLNESK